MSAATAAEGIAGGDRVKSARSSSFHFPAEQPLGIAVGDAPGLLLEAARASRDRSA
jgi:hypothetical protein